MRLSFLVILLLFALLIMVESRRRPSRKPARKPARRPSRPKPKPKPKPSRPSRPSRPSKPVRPVRPKPPTRPTKPKPPPPPPVIVRPPTRPTKPPTTTPKKPDPYAKWTAAPNGTKCWWDLRRDDCATCQPGGKQCGYPLHDKCFQDIPNKGCPGIPNPDHTLSTRGYPCYWDPTDFSCAWCAPGSLQCGKGHDSTCVSREEELTCNGVMGDCKHIPKCSD